MRSAYRRDGQARLSGGERANCGAKGRLSGSELPFQWPPPRVPTSSRNWSAMGT